MKIDNKRNFFRVDMLMPMNWHILNQAETDLVKNGSGGKLLTQSYLHSQPEEMPENESTIKNDRIYQYFRFLNNKLDHIINMMPKDYGSGYATDKIVEISASGLRFITSKKIEPGVFLKMNLLIPGGSNFQMELIAETLRVEKIDNGYLLAANIICIDEEAREFIVKMIFQKQRLDIRRLKTPRKESKND